MSRRATIHRWSARDEAAKVREALAAHDRLDTERFNALALTLEEIRADVKSLLASRSYVRGAWKAVVTTAAVVSTVVSLLFAWLRVVR
jgi:hypothetical protein